MACHRSSADEKVQPHHEHGRGRDHDDLGVSDVDVTHVMLRRQVRVEACIRRRSPMTRLTAQGHAQAVMRIDRRGAESIGR